MSHLRRNPTPRITTRVNGTVVQDGSTKGMICTVPQIISYINDTITLQAAQ